MPLPVAQMYAKVAWEFYDPVTVSTYTFPINPKEGGDIDYDKTLLTTATSAADGVKLVAEGQPAPQNLAWSGTVYSQAEYAAFVTWQQKANQIRITDDLGRVFWVVFKKVSFKRRKKIHYQWFHEYSAEALVLSLTMP